VVKDVADEGHVQRLLQTFVQANAGQQRGHSISAINPPTPFQP
jgi:hypothetical protein